MIHGLILDEVVKMGPFRFVAPMVNSQSQVGESLRQVFLQTSHGAENDWSFKHSLTPPKADMDTQNDGLEKVVPFKYGHFWYPC